MKHVIHRLSMLFCLFISATLWSATNEQEAGQETLVVPRVVFVLDNRAGNYLPILKGFREYSRKQVGRLIRIDLINSENLSQAELIQQLSGDYDLAVTIGISATKSVINNKADIPIFALKINQAELRALHRNGAKNQRLITGIFRDQPFERYAKLIQSALPQYKRVGVLLSQNSKTLKPDFDAVMRQYRFEPVVTIVRRNDLPQRVLERLANRSDIIVAIFDDDIYSPDNVKSHLLTAFRHQIPMIGVTRGYTDIGAAASLYSDDYELGNQTARQVIKILDLNSAELAPVYPDSFKLRVNYNVLRSFGISALDEAQIVRQIQQTKITTE
ncbi:ABC transporter substrate-binding protein [Pleionea litopenaei]|uniref:ABC transporter substrate binding protein n=1 Tax=Pleionea litopenaei TaxID=3070815 RepID=A0AA51RVU8_9GAMM|nr:ABC transporter substrate binding protein [Pleionea sp. HL-JVS1]WMS88547.1 ABC transporter substrate binding protein [Pleionea sp. HL-JVS1]